MHALIARLFIIGYNVDLSANGQNHALCSMKFSLLIKDLRDTRPYEGILKRGLREPSKAQQASKPPRFRIESLRVNLKGTHHVLGAAVQYQLR